jgi:hypothetical protein
MILYFSVKVNIKAYDAQVENILLCGKSLPGVRKDLFLNL